MTQVHSFRKQSSIGGRCVSLAVMLSLVSCGCAGPAPATAPASSDDPQSTQDSNHRDDAADVQAGDAPAPNTRVMMVSFDGLRPDAINASRTPNLQSLIDGGSAMLAAQAEFPCVTLPNHASMVTGLSILRHGVLFNSSVEGRISRRTIFDVAKDSAISRGFFVTKPKLNYLCAEADADVRVVKTDIDVLADETAAAIRSHELSLIFLHFGEPDGAGHSHGWMSQPYLEQVARADAAFGRVLAALRERDLFDRTLLIVTADHGGHGKVHGFDIPEDRNVPFILSGPGIAAGRRLCEVRRPMDAAMMALHALGLPTESAMDGVLATEAMADSTPPPCGEFVMQNAYVTMCGPLPILFMAPALLTVRLFTWRRRRARAPESRRAM